MKRLHSILSIMLALVLCIGLAVPAMASGEPPSSETASSEPAQSAVLSIWADPGSDESENAKPMLRFWFPDAGAGLTQSEIDELHAQGFTEFTEEYLYEVIDILHELYDAGFGGIEMTMLADSANYGTELVSKIGWGTPAWVRILCQALATGNSLGKGDGTSFKVDVTMTAHWPLIIDTVDPNDAVSDSGRNGPPAAAEGADFAEAGAGGLPASAKSAAPAGGLSRAQAAAFRSPRLSADAALRTGAGRAAPDSRAKDDDASDGKSKAEEEKNESGKDKDKDKKTQSGRKALLNRRIRSGDITTGRLRIWRDYLSLSGEIGLFGLSPENASFFIQEHDPDLYIASFIRENYPKNYAAGYVFHTHSGYLRVFVSTGFVGSALLLIFMALCAIRAIRYVGAVKAVSPAFLFSFLAVLAGASSALFDNEIFFTQNPTSLVFWLCLCVMVKSSSVSDRVSGRVFA